MSTVPSQSRPRQVSFPEFCAVKEAVELLASSGGIEARGAIFTRREVVEFLLDLTGYVESKDLTKQRLLEPSFGGGDFLLPAIERLMKSWKERGGAGDPTNLLADSIRAVELHRSTFLATKQRAFDLLVLSGLSNVQASALVDTWVLNGDFLLTDLDGEFDVVIGNPPYVRQELIPDILLAEYRNRYSTIYDRADLYVPFIERSLTSLCEGGILGFICADRWMKNRYGGPLRHFVSQKFHLKVYVDMTGVPAFHSDVIAYPAITVISKERGKVTRVARTPELQVHTLRSLSNALTAPEVPGKESGITSLEAVASGSQPWILDTSDQLAIIRRVEGAFPTLEEAGCKVGIGVATGADQAFIAPFETLDVEDDRKLPLVMTKDIQEGIVKWRGLGVVNPFSESGGLVNLADFPRLRRYLEARKDQIARRHCAQKVPANWYRTIDRITPSIASTPKLLIPDIKGDAHIVYESGELYPHHNLYYVTSRQWDLRALQAVLLSSVTRLFIATYSTKMHGGFLRFQAQYLRRVRLPSWNAVSEDIRARLIEAASSRDTVLCNAAAFDLYGLNYAERAVLGGE